jgi:hypothetical protein
VSVDDTVRQALEAFERGPIPFLEPRQPRDLSPAAVAARKASMDRLVEELAAMPILDPRPLKKSWTI